MLSRALKARFFVKSWSRFHGVFAPNFKHRERIVPRRTQRTVEHDKPVAPMSWIQRLKRVFAMDSMFANVRL